MNNFTDAGVRATILLLILLIILWLLQGFLPNSGGLFGNLISELCGALITLWVIDTILKSGDDLERKRQRSIVMKSLRQPVRNIIWAWLQVVNTPEEPITPKIKEQGLGNYLVSDEFIVALQNIDLSETIGQKIFGHGKHKFKLLPESMEYFVNDVRSLLGNFSNFLDDEQLDLLIHFAYRAHLYNIIRLKHTVENSVPNGSDRGRQWFADQNTENLKKHFTKLVLLLNMYNQHAYEEDNLTSDNILTLYNGTEQDESLNW